MPMDEAQFRAAFAAYQTELDTLSPPGDRDEWQLAQQRAAIQRLAVITGTHPQSFPNIGNPDQAWEWYRDNNPYATGAFRAAMLFGCYRRATSRPTDPCVGVHDAN